MKKYCTGYGEKKEYDPLFCFGVSAHRGGRYPNLVGCQQMHLNIGIYGSGIYYYGKWINRVSDFLYDKGVMDKFISQAAKDYSDCPFMNVRKAQEFVFWWPDKVNPVRDEGFATWPPVIGEFEGELNKIGLSMSGPPLTPNGEEYPVITDTSFFLGIIDSVYGKYISEDIKAGLLASYNEICEQMLHYFD